MARAQAQYLRIFSGSTTYQRWQSYYVNTSVTYGGAVWAISHLMLMASPLARCNQNRQSQSAACYHQRDGGSAASIK
jgi:hypothetical protein